MCRREALLLITAFCGERKTLLDEQTEMKQNEKALCQVPQSNYVQFVCSMHVCEHFIHYSYHNEWARVKWKLFGILHLHIQLKIMLNCVLHWRFNMAHDWLSLKILRGRVCMCAGALSVRARWSWNCAFFCAVKITLRTEESSLILGLYNKSFQSAEETIIHDSSFNFVVRESILSGKQGKAARKQ